MSEEPQLLIDPIRARDNNLNLIRLALALAVLFSHCFPLSQGTERADWAYIATRGQLNLGDVAVDAFFIISGFLILQSWDHSAWPMAYLGKRVLRIYPAFLVAIAFSVLVAGTLGAPDTKVYLSALGAHAGPTFGGWLTLQPPTTPPTFLALPYPAAVNGSLWTIRPEFECYLFVVLVGLLEARARSVVLAGLFLSLLAMRTTAPLGEQAANAVRFGLCFVAGTFGYQYRARLPRRVSWFVLAIGGLVVTAVAGIGFETWLVVGGAYALFYLAFHARVIRTWLVAGGRDWSYGVYLYAWPIQQLTAWWIGRALTPYAMFALVLGPTLGVAAASWVFIERPALGRKPAVSARARGVVTQARRMAGAGRGDRGVAVGEA